MQHLTRSPSAFGKKPPPSAPPSSKPLQIPTSFYNPVDLRPSLKTQASAPPADRVQHRHLPRLRAAKSLNSFPWHQGAERGIFEGQKFQADVTKSPVPRFDLLKLDQYLHVGVQFSRGCPFNCEFCDIIELYGRVPRTKTTPQTLAELEELYRLGYRGHVDFVIGNKKVLKVFLPELTAWLKERNYPFEFSTEASINLADDHVLLEQMKDANFFAIFVGIESPDTDTLVSMQKRQNTRRSLAESVHKIYQAGIFVNGGFIVGFDTEKASVAEGMIECIEDTAIPACMVGLLYALPNTQLTRRLEREGRLFANHDISVDSSSAGFNRKLPTVIPIGW